MSNERKTKFIAFKVTEKELRKFEAARKKLGMDKSGYARHKLFYEGEGKKSG